MKNKVHKEKLKQTVLALASLAFFSQSISAFAIGNPLSGSRPLGFFDGALYSEDEVPPYVLACQKDRTKCQKNGSVQAPLSVDVPAGNSVSGDVTHPGRTVRFKGSGADREPTYGAAVAADISGLTLSDCPEGLCSKSALDRVRADFQRNFDTTELALAAADIVNELHSINEALRADEGMPGIVGMTATGAQGRVRQLQTEWARATSKTYDENQVDYRNGEEIIARSAVLQAIESRFDTEMRIFNDRLGKELGSRGQHLRP